MKRCYLYPILLLLIPVSCRFNIEKYYENIVGDWTLVKEGVVREYGKLEDRKTIRFVGVDTNQICWHISSNKVVITRNGVKQEEMRIRITDKFIIEMRGHAGGEWPLKYQVFNTNTGDTLIVTGLYTQWHYVRKSDSGDSP